MELKRLDNLDPRRYEHPFDARALDVLQHTKGLDLLVKKFYEFGVERIWKVQFIGSSLRVTASSFPVLHDLLDETCQTLHLMYTPAVYVHRSDDLQGLTLGVEEPMILLSHTSLETFDDDELRFLLGREIGHIKSQHVLYYEIAMILPLLADMMPATVAALLQLGLGLSLLRWRRMSEYTADRAGLLACQNVATATTALAKMAGLPATHFDAFNLDDFAVQAREYESIDETRYDKVLKYLSEMFAEQQWAVDRASQLYHWIDEGAYKQVLETPTQPALASASEAGTKFCTNCGNGLAASANFCPACGTAVV